MEYFVIAADAALTVYMIRLHRLDCKTINAIKNAPVVEIGSDLVSLVESSPDQTLPYAIVQGNVTALKGTVKSSTGEKGVIHISTLQEVTRKYGDFFEFRESVPPANESRKVVPFGLKSSSDPTEKIYVEVLNPFESVWENLLTTVSSTFIPKNSTISTTLMGSICNAKTQGLRSTERFLPLGKVITGVGTIIRDPKKGILKLQEPLDSDSIHPYILTSLSRDELLSRLKSRRDIQRLIIGMTAAIGLVLLGRKMVSWWRLWKLKRMRDKIIQERKATNLDNLCPCRTCLVCSINPREVIIFNCGHICICADCAMKVNGMCPVCREKITSTKKAYIA